MDLDHGLDDLTECCVMCDEARRESFPEGDLRRLGRSMIVCPTCGNKRCPKATNHRFAYTNSNEPGQPGSIYLAPPASRMADLNGRLSS